MPANIMQNFSYLAPEKDFFESFVSPLLLGQKLAQQKEEQKKLEIENQFMPAKLEAELLGQQAQNEGYGLQNEARRTKMPFLAPTAEAELIGQHLLNENRGLQNQFMPQEFQMKQQQHAMANSLKNMQMQKYQAEIDQMNNPESNSHNMLDGPSDVATLGWIGLLESQGKYEEAEMLKQKYTGTEAKYSSLNADAKRAWDARANALGIPSNEAMSIFNSNKSLEDVAAEKGMSQEKIAEAGMQHHATTPSITAGQKKLVASKAGEVLSEMLPDLIGDYANDMNYIEGLSTKQLVDYITQKESDPIKLGNFLAATYLIPEAVGLNAASILSGGQVGIEALEHFRKNYPIKVKALDKIIPLEARNQAFKVYNKINGYLSDKEQDIIANLPKYQEEARENVKEFESKSSEAEAMKKYENMSDEELEALANG